MSSSLRDRWSRWPTSIPDSWPDSNEPGFVVLDVETTGLSPNGDRIIEIGLVRTDLDGIPVGRWSQLIDPRRPIGASDIHGITAAELKGAPTFADIADEILERMRGTLLVAHNAHFDLTFLSAEMTRSGWNIPQEPLVCTMAESAHFLPGLSRKRLADCVEAIGFDGKVLHRALGDATLASALLFFYLNGPMNPTRSAVIRDLGVIARTAPWPIQRDAPTIDTATPPIIVYRTRPKAVSRVAERVSEVMPEDLLDKDATAAELSYGAKLLEVIQDGVISRNEKRALQDLQESMNIKGERADEIHRRLLWALAFEAWHDGVVNRNEQWEVIAIAKDVGLSEADAKSYLRDVENLRKNRIAARTASIPDGIDLGEPIRVGDRVVFTGCYDDGRDEMEDQARRRGLRVTGSVSGRTSLLVTDGTINGIKEREASRLGIRKVNPDQFRTLLYFIQPEVPQDAEQSKSRAKSESAKPSWELQGTKFEKLVCLECDSIFERVVVSGRKPHFCQSCKQ